VLGKRLGVDLGAESLRIVVRGEGQVFAEPAVVARHRRRGYAAAGLPALELAADPEMELVRPLRGGLIIDRSGVAALLQRAINRGAGRQRIFRPDVVVAVSPPMSGDDRLTILDICAQLGTRTAYLIDSPVAAAMGAGQVLSGPRAHLIADIGAGTVDVACLASEGTIAGRTLSQAGDDLRTAVRRRLRERLGEDLGDVEAEEVVTSLACVGQHEERRMPLRLGADGEERFVEVVSTEIADLVDEHSKRIAQAVREVIDETPVTLRREVLQDGISLCGGGARLEGLDRYLGLHCGCPARVVQEPQTCVIRGTQIAVENLDVLKRSFVYIR